LGGGVVLTLCHPFDYLRWLLGDVAEVTAELKTTGALDLEVEDIAEVILQFETGAFANVHLDYVTRPTNHSLEVIGTEGTLRWDQEDGSVRWWSTSNEAWATITAPEGFERNRMFLDEIQDFLDLMAGGTSPVCTLDDGIRALEISLAARRSSSEGKRIQLFEASSKVSNC
jgi:predicted dehydrogenase